MIEEEPRVWAVMTPEEGSFVMRADSIEVSAHRDRLLLNNGEVVGVYPPGFAVWLCEQEDDDEG